MSNISQRKDEHIKLALESAHQSVEGAGFDRIVFEHCALPELALKDIQLDCHFLGQKLSAPLMIGAMTGGCSAGEAVNRHLAEAAEYCRIPMALGSQRAELELGGKNSIRSWAPNAVLLSNLGATQLLSAGPELALRAVESIRANALMIHLNPLQELVQQGGDRDWNNVLDAMAETVNRLSVPVLVKEVGSGIGPATAKKLANIGISGIDVAGRGGTSWPSIEFARNMSSIDRAIAEPFLNWGMQTAELLPLISDLPECGEITLIGSGGIRSGLDIAKCLRLGAGITALAQPFLKPAQDSAEAVIEKINVLTEQLRWTMFLTGSRNIMALKCALLMPKR